MRCAAALSTKSDSEAALREVVDRLYEGFAGEQADLALVFASIHHADVLGRLGAELTARGLGRHVLGCTGETIIGEDREVEGDPALSAWAIRLPGAELKPIRIDSSDDGLDTLQGFTDGPDSILLLGDPFSFVPDPWLQKLGALAPGIRVIGGMASASHVPRENRLLLDGQVFEDGAVGMVLGGEVSIRTLVSQGCRPIGRPMIVTRVDRNLIRELGRRPCLEVLREIFEELTEDDQERVQSGLHIGRVINEYQENFRRGDFLVRNVMGADDSGGDRHHRPRPGRPDRPVPRPGRRDRRRGPEEPGRLRTPRPPQRPGRRGPPLQLQRPGDPPLPRTRPRRGRPPRRFGPIPVAGFFAMGEIGPVGGQNFVHGYTASVVLFEETGEKDG